MNVLALLRMFYYFVRPCSYLFYHFEISLRQPLNGNLPQLADLHLANLISPWRAVNAATLPLAVSLDRTSSVLMVFRGFLSHRGIPKSLLKFLKSWSTDLDDLVHDETETSIYLSFGARNGGWVTLFTKRKMSNMVDKLWIIFWYQPSKLSPG